MESKSDSELRVDRTAFSIAPSFEEAQDEADWRFLAPAERAARLEVMPRLTPRIRCEFES